MKGKSVHILHTYVCLGSNLDVVLHFRDKIITSEIGNALIWSVMIINCVFYCHFVLPFHNRRATSDFWLVMSVGITESWWFLTVFIYSLVLLALIATAFALEAPICPADDGGVPIHFPQLDDCRHFWKCNNGVASEQMCPIGLHWNSEKEYCDWPWEANCVEREA